MKTKLLIRGAKTFSVAALLTMLSGCVTSPTASPTAQRDSSGAVRYTWVTKGGRKVPVEVVHDFPPPYDL